MPNPYISFIRYTLYTFTQSTPTSEHTVSVHGGYRLRGHVDRDIWGEIYEIYASRDMRGDSIERECIRYLVRWDSIRTTESGDNSLQSSTPQAGIQLGWAVSSAILERWDMAGWWVLYRSGYSHIITWVWWHRGVSRVWGSGGFPRICAVLVWVYMSRLI